MKKQSKQKRVKAWAVVTTRGKLEYDAMFNGGDCCCSGEPQALAVYDKVATALDSVGEHYKQYYRILPCEIIIKN